MGYKLPEEITTSNPKEAIGFCISYGIEEGILPKDFKMSEEGFQILESAVLAVWDKQEPEIINQIMIAFVAGYATGSKQVRYRE